MAKYSGKNYPVTRNGLNAARDATSRNRDQISNRRGGQYGNLLNRQLPTDLTSMRKTPGGDAPTNPTLPACPPGFTHALGGNAWGMGGGSGVESGWQGGQGPAFCTRIIGRHVGEENE